MAKPTQLPVAQPLPLSVVTKMILKRPARAPPSAPISAPVAKVVTLPKISNAPPSLNAIDVDDEVDYGVMSDTMRRPSPPRTESADRRLPNRRRDDTPPPVRSRSPTPPVVSEVPAVEAEAPMVPPSWPKRSEMTAEQKKEANARTSANKKKKKRAAKIASQSEGDKAARAASTATSDHTSTVRRVRWEAPGWKPPVPEYNHEFPEYPQDSANEMCDEEPEPALHLSSTPQFTYTEIAQKPAKRSSQKREISDVNVVEDEATEMTERSDLDSRSALLLTQNSKYPSKISIENFVPSEIKGYRTNAFKDVNKRLSLVPEGAISIKKILKMAEDATLRLVAYGQVSIIKAIHHHSLLRVLGMEIYLELSLEPGPIFREPRTFFRLDTSSGSR